MISLPEDAWLVSSRDGRFARRGAHWIHGPAARSEWQGLAVPGARDLRLAEIVVPRVGESWRRTPTRHSWDDGLPYGMHADWLYVTRGVADGAPELVWLRDEGERTMFAYRVDLVGAPASLWETRGQTIVGLRAPELSSGFERFLAEAAVDLARCERQLLRAGSERQVLVLGAVRAGWTRGRLALAMGLSRTRVQQLVGKAAADGQAVVRADGVEPEGLGRRLAGAQRTHAKASALRLEAQRTRRRRAAKARELGISFGAIARCLDVSRGRAQQLVLAEQQEPPGSNDAVS